MKRILLTTASLILLGATLSACGGGGGGGSTTTATVTPPAARFDAQFGANFSTANQVSPNSEPRDIAPGDTIAVNPTAEPVALPGT